MGSMGTLGCLGSWIGAAALVHPQASQAGTPGHSLEAWLNKVRAAGSSVNFQGTFVVTAEGMSSSSRIAHYGVGRDSYERIESLDGPPRSHYRHNDTVHTVWPRTRTVVVEPRSASGGFPALAAQGNGSVDQLYRIDAPVEGRVAGRDAWVLLATSVDQSRHSHRLWVDQRTNLLLRSDILGVRGEVLETASFSDVTIGVKAQAAAVMEAMNLPPAPWRVVRAAVHAADLAKEGWQWDVDTTGLSGFKLVSCIRRPIKPGTDDASGQPPALQAVFSDGLAMVSVFVENPRGPRPRGAQAQTMGATHTLAVPAGDAWLTVVGDIPAPLAERFAKALRRKVP
jgi:sigma-E factor negative regulatory protein RseB